MPADAGEPRITVVVAAYQAAATIERSLESVLAQTLTDLEVIVVDDGSTDDTVARVQRIAARDPRVRLIVQPRNGGPAVARNTALQAARGRWVTPVDADDAILPQRLERLLQHAERMGADLMADNLFFDGGSTEPSNLAYRAGAQETTRLLSAHALLESDMPRNNICSFGYLKPLMRRDFLIAQGLSYDEDLRIGEDLQLYVRATMAGGRFGFTDWPGYSYYRNSGSLTHAPDRQIENLHAAIESSQRLLDRALQEPRQDAAVLRQLRRHGVRLRLTLWIDRVRRALRNRDYRDLLKLAGRPPPHCWLLVPLALRRLLRGRSVDPVEIRGAPAA